MREPPEEGAKNALEGRGDEEDEEDDSEDEGLGGVGISSEWLSCRHSAFPKRCLAKQHIVGMRVPRSQENAPPP